MPEFETDEYHDYFITRLFVRDGFYDYQNVVENVVEDFSQSVINVLSGYSSKKRNSATKILKSIKNDSRITIAQIATKTGMTGRTVQRYLQEFQKAGILKREGSDANGMWIIV